MAKLATAAAVKPREATVNPRLAVVYCRWLVVNRRQAVVNRREALVDRRVRQGTPRNDMVDSGNSALHHCADSPNRRKPLLFAAREVAEPRERALR